MRRQSMGARRLDGRTGSARSSAAAALVAVLLAGGMATPVLADTFPKRRAGLWETRNTGGPMGSQTMQQCIDGSTDDLLRDQSDEDRKCTKPVVKRSGDRYDVAMTCEGDGVRSAMEGRYTMRGDTAYQGQMKIRMTPPMEGIAEMNMQVDGRWLGPCKPGMKPGDMVMPGVPGLGGGVNLLGAGQGGGQMSPEEARKAAEEILKGLKRP